MNFIATLKHIHSQDVKSFFDLSEAEVASCCCLHFKAACVQGPLLLGSYLSFQICCSKKEHWGPARGTMPSHLILRLQGPGIRVASSRCACPASVKSVTFQLGVFSDFFVYRGQNIVISLPSPLDAQLFLLRPRFISRTPPHFTLRSHTLLFLNVDSDLSRVSYLALPFSKTH